MNKNDLKVVLIGQTGVGKSQLGNFILQQEYFKVGYNKNSETEIISEGYGHLDGMNVTIVDTPGLNDTGSKDEEIMNQIVKKFQEDNAIDGIILVYSFREPKRYQKHRELVNNLLKIFGKDLLEKRLKVIFTNSTVGEERDKLEEEKERIQVNDTKEFLNNLIKEDEMIFLNSKKNFYDKFRPKIIELFNQIYDIKKKYGSINNALIKKKELEFIEKEKQREKERMEKELKRQKEEQRKEKERMEKELKRQKEEHEREKREELEKQQKEKEIRKKKLEELKDINASIKDYETKISETSKKLDQIREDHNFGKIIGTSATLGSAALIPFTFGLSAIPTAVCVYSRVKGEKQYMEKVKDLEKDLENYRIQIEKLREKKEDIKLFYFN